MGTTVSILSAITQKSRRREPAGSYQRLRGSLAKTASLRAHSVPDRDDVTERIISWCCLVMRFQSSNHTAALETT
jgi:hypothetical protein